MVSGVEPQEHARLVGEQKENHNWNAARYVKRALVRGDQQANDVGHSGRGNKDQRRGGPESDRIVHRPG